MREAQCVRSRPVHTERGVPCVLPLTVELYVWMSGCASIQITWRSRNRCREASVDELATE